MIVTTISEHGSVEAIRMLESMVGRGEEMAPVWTKVHEYFMKIEQTQFSSGGRRSSAPNPWDNLADSTIARKRDGGFRLKKMYRTEQLVQALTHAGADGQVYHADHNAMVFGADLDSYVAQQGGIEGIPFRPPVDPTDRDIRTITMMVASYVTGATPDVVF